MKNGLDFEEFRAAANEIKKAVPFRRAAEYYGIEFDRQDFCRCPFHSERTASFKAYPDSGHCFGCGWDGDIFDLVGRLWDLSFQDSVARVNDDLALGYPISRRATLRERAELSRRAREISAAREAEKAQEEADLADILAFHALAALEAQAPKGSLEQIKVLCELDYAAYRAGCAEERAYYRRRCKTL